MRERSRHSASTIMSISLLRNGDRLAVRPAAPASQACLLPWVWCLGFGSSLAPLATLRCCPPTPTAVRARLHHTHSNAVQVSATKRSRPFTDGRPLQTAAGEDSYCCRLSLHQVVASGRMWMRVRMREILFTRALLYVGVSGCLNENKDV